MTGKQFVYENVRLSDDRLSVNFDYKVITDENTFQLSEKLTFSKPLPDNDVANRLLRAIHIGLGVSYYKTFLPPQINHDYTMNEDEAYFWNDVFRNGLGEFLHTNNLSAEQLAQFTAQTGNIEVGAQDTDDWQPSALLGIGGGKDSIVAGELLKNAEIPLSGFVLATGDNVGQTQGVADVMKVSLNVVKRKVDPQILEMNKMDGALNGHIPISLVFALVGCILACIEKSKYVIVANESSASIPQVQGTNGSVNHQWSKSLEFEKQFQAYVHKYVTENIHYTSVIRPLSSVAVAKLFCKMPAYFEVFSSDNSLLKINPEKRDHPRWSLNSPKSLSSFILLAPWLSDEEVLRIFGRNFLDEASLSQLFLDLLGAGETPVLDCVGTPDELRLSLAMLQNQNRYQETPLMKQAMDHGLITDNFEAALAEALKPKTDHAVPQELSERLFPLFKEYLG